MDINQFLQSRREEQAAPACAVTFTRRQMHFLRAYRSAMGIISDASEASGVPRRTVYNWLQNIPAFKQACAEISEETVDMVENALMKLVEARNERAIIFYLKTKGRSRGYF